MKRLASLVFACATLLSLASGRASAYYGYYSNWSYYPTYSYYYTTYYYTPSSYHYCVYYPSQPYYVYYYNPYRQVYWGRYDLKAKGYSKLAPEDQKKSLKDIPDSAFPKPGPMPESPAGNGQKMARPPAPPKDLPPGQE